MFRYPDNPKLVSVDFLRTLDADAPGAWIGSAKMDGRRRVAIFDGARWDFRAKNRDDAQPLPEDLRAEFEDVMTWHSPITYDCEWCGLRAAGDEQRIYIFDVLHVDGRDLYGVPYRQRYELLHELDKGLKALGSRRVQVVRHEWNPHLIEFYMEQLTEPLSEGIVVRAANSTIIGNPNRAVDNPEMFKVKFQRVTEKV